MFNILIGDVPIFKTQILYLSALRNRQKKTTGIYESEEHMAISLEDPLKSIHIEVLH